MGLCKSPLPAPMPAPLCSTSGPARSPRELCQKALLPAQVWQPQEAPARQGKGGGTSPDVWGLAPTYAKPELWLETR